MTKFKINPGLACAMLVASIFAGWEAVLLVTILMFAFCEIDENVKGVAVRVISFYIGYTLISLGWSVITGGVGVITDVVEEFVGILNNFRDYDELISVSKFTGTVNGIVNILDTLVSYGLLLARFGFIISIFTFKKFIGTPISSKVDEYMTKVLNYINGDKKSEK